MPSNLANVQNTTNSVAFEECCEGQEGLKLLYIIINLNFDLILWTTNVVNAQGPYTDVGDIHIVGF